MNKKMLEQTMALIEQTAQLLRGLIQQTEEEPCFPDCFPDDVDTKLIITDFPGKGRTAHLMESISGMEITDIAEFAFRDSKLEHIDIPCTVERIGKGAFSNEHLTRITVDEGNQYFVAIDGVLFKKHETTYFGDKLILFAYPPGKKDDVYFIPDFVDEIAPMAFMWCRHLKRVVIPKGVRHIRESAFYGGYALQVIDVSEDNPNYVSPGGVLYDKAMTTLLAYPSCRVQSARTYKIPYGVRRIGDAAVACTANLTNLVVPETIVSIGELVGEAVMMRIHCADDSYAREFFGKNMPDEIFNKILRYNKSITVKEEEDGAMVSPV
ncbi:MAG: leucine-rich repeat domain-containing protein [Defluviitaleaceae bacterium]|nr:leucine-rich repeat domain-containing protein [Defluviitaleaceae bacterium]